LISLPPDAFCCPSTHSGGGPGKNDEAPDEHEGSFQVTAQ